MARDIENIDHNSRGVNLRNQVLLSFLIKGIGIGLNFLIIPITLGYLGKEKYGIWITLLSIISWVTLFDIGIGNGLRNKLTEALAVGDKVSARKYISTAYYLLCIVALILCLLLLLFSFTFNWVAVFKSQLLSNTEYSKICSVFFITISLSFLLGLINPILNAFQLTSLTNIGSVITNGLFIILLNILSGAAKDNLLFITSLYCVSLIFSNVVVSVIFFCKKPWIIPALRWIDHSKRDSILKLGGSFFLIQISALLIFTVDNFLIIQLLGPVEVSVYNIVYKLFSIFILGYGILMAPMWSAFTEANVKGEYKWIDRTIRKLNLSMGVVVIGVILLSLFYQPILNMWLPTDRRIIPSRYLIYSMGAFVIISVWNNIYAFYLNGIGDTKIQVITAIVGAGINIPLAYCLVRFMHLGLSGVVLAMCFSLFIFSVIGPYIAFQKIHSNGSRSV